MDPARFTSREFGEIVKTPGRHGFYTYLPAPLPRALTLTAGTVARLSDADRALGRLAGAGRLLPNPHLLVNAYRVREALASARIEGTQATLSDVFDAEARGEMPGDTREVINYIRAMEVGLDRLEALPLTRRLFEEIHAVLLEGVRGGDRSPGEIRRSPNWIGSPDNRPETAIFVPPPVDALEVGISDWEKFVHEDSDMPPLIKCALLHYQFETLHPFLDGNGRLGRLLIIFFLVSGGYLPAPLLYVSSYFEQHKPDYYDYLQGVRERGKLQEWLQFFLRAISEQANDAVTRAELLLDVRERYRAELRGTRSRAHEVVDGLLENPIVTAQSVARRLNVTVQGASNLIKQLESAHILVPALRPSGRAYRWIATDVFAVLNG